MRAILAGLALALLIASPVSAAPKTPTGTLTITSLDATIGGAVTFSATTANLKGYQYPLVYLACVVDGRTVYGQLALPSDTFILGGGSSPWIDPNDPDYLAPATCTAYLYVYPGPSDLLDQTAPFLVG